MDVVQGKQCAAGGTCAGTPQLLFAVDVQPALRGITGQYEATVIGLPVKRSLPLKPPGAVLAAAAECAAPSTLAPQSLQGALASARRDAQQSMKRRRAAKAAFVKERAS